MKNKKHFKKRYFSLFCAILFIPFVLQAQNLQVRGRVVDSQNLPLIGVNVIEKGTTKGTITDQNGDFVLNVPTETVLVFSYIGFVDKEIVWNGTSYLNIVLQEDVELLDEVVVIGYGSRKRADITGSIAVVDTKQLQSVKSTSAAQALQGLASGVNVTLSGVPGNAPRINIRGLTSFGNNDPLVIVDGIEQNLNNISASDIESIQVLKDAGSASIYGVRGANGVILITTNKGGGDKGKPVMTYDGSYGIQFPLQGNVWNILNTEDYAKVYNIAFPNNERFKNGIPDYMYRGPGGDGVAFEGDPAIDLSNYYYESPNRGNNYLIQKVNKEGTDWFHELFKSAPTTNHTLSLSGGGAHSKYLFSLGYLDQRGTLIKTVNKRYTVRINSEYNLGKYVKVGENLSFIHKYRQGFSENTQFGGITETIKMQPIIPVKDVMGNWGGSYAGPDMGDSRNPVAEQYRNADEDKNVPLNYYFTGNIFAEVNFLKNFTARSSLGYNIDYNFNQSFDQPNIEASQGNGSEYKLSVSSGLGSVMTFTNTLNYQNVFSKHKLDILMGSEAIKDVSRSVSGSREDFFTDNIYYLVLGSGAKSINNSSSINDTRLFSLFGRLDYSFDNKYLTSMTVRRDGSSKFGSGRKYGVFPSFSAAWRLSEESLLKDISWIDDLKIRGSYGILGSQNNVSAANAFTLYGIQTGDGNASYYDIIGTGTSEVQGFRPSRLGNNNTGWEENVISNIGFDATVLNNRLSFSIEYYNKSINGLLFEEPLPAVIIAGSSAPTVNIGDIQNSGIDLSVEYRGDVNKLKYSLRTDFTSYKNKIVDIPSPGYFETASVQNVGNIVRNEIGHPIGSFYGYRILDIFGSDEEVASAPTQDAAAPGRFRFKDLNGDEKITPDDREYIGNPHPDFTAGFHVGLQYKNFDLSAFFYASIGHDIANLTKLYTHFMSYYSNTNKSNDLLNAWTPENKNTSIPKIETSTTFSSSSSISDFFIEDGSFLKMKNLQLGYTFESIFLDKLNISSLRIYTQLANVFTLTKYSGLDPELIGGSSSYFGRDYGSYPNNELSVNFGVSLKF